jgi:hypothetical protein
MHRNLYLVAAIIGAVATAVVAAQHELVWTVVGALSVGCNIFNYINEQERKDGI